MKSIQRYKWILISLGITVNLGGDVEINTPWLKASGSVQVQIMPVE